MRWPLLVLCPTTAKVRRPLYWHFLKTVKTVSQGNLCPVRESRCPRLLRTTQVKRNKRRGIEVPMAVDHDVLALIH
jgi:hypothetical protein